MRQSWPVWSVFAAAVLVVAGAMAWLTLKAWEVDQAETVARAERDREADAGRVLWKLDAFLTPLVAEEAARPHWAYQPVLVSEGKPPRRVLSPLLHPPQYVLLHFTQHPNGVLDSPQCPPENIAKELLAEAMSKQERDTACARLTTLQAALSKSQLALELPEATMSLDALEGEAVYQTNSIQQEDVTTGTRQNLNDTVQHVPQIARRGQQSLSELNSGLSMQLENDYRNREQAAQNYASRSRMAQMNQNGVPVGAGGFTATAAAEGASVPLWVGEKLIVARKVRVNGQSLVQGFWLDWDALRERLTEEATAVLPGVSLSPLRNTAQAEPNRLLAILPIEITLPPMSVASRDESPLRWALGAAWIGLLLAGVAAGITLHKVIALSERRAAFVSAVTHELRTPLTTFRLYADMLAGGVVPDESRRQEYLETLRREADRLAHLVDNVLQYARLERGRPGGRRESLRMGELLDRMVPRFADRAKQAEMELLVQVAPEQREETISTDPQAVEQILFNLVDNAAKYAAHAAERRITIRVDYAAPHWRVAVSDCGPGVPQSVRRRLFQPFCKPAEEAARTAPGVGLGLALSRRLAADLGGQLQLAEQRDGARFVLELRS